MGEGFWKSGARLEIRGWTAQHSKWMEMQMWIGNSDIIQSSFFKG